MLQVWQTSISPCLGWLATWYHVPRPAQNSLIRQTRCAASTATVAGSAEDLIRAVEPPLNQVQG